MPKTSTQERSLSDLVSIGPAMLRDFNKLGIHSVTQLAKAKPRTLYDRLSKITGHHQDPCVLDSFTCAIAQAKDPTLSTAKKNWWYWSRIRKAAQKRNDR